MKKITKISIAILFFAAIASCTKDNMRTASTQQSTNQSAQNATDGVQAVHRIGDSFGGGIIFYLDSTKQHGFIVTPSDLDANGEFQIRWYNGTYKSTGATATTLGTGAQNTAKIVKAQGSGTYAAQLCSDLVLNGFSDWYLPSKAELNKLYLHKGKVPGLGATNYWSSSEYGKMRSWDQEFGGGFQFKDDKSFTLRVRAIRSF